MKTKSILSFTWILIFLLCLSGPVNSAQLTNLSRLPAPDVARVAASSRPGSWPGRTPHRSTGVRQHEARGESRRRTSSVVFT